VSHVHHVAMVMCCSGPLCQVPSVELHEQEACCWLPDICHTLPDVLFVHWRARCCCNARRDAEHVWVTFSRFFLVFVLPITACFVVCRGGPGVSTHVEIWATRAC
jgi:hypothetical protein